MANLQNQPIDWRIEEGAFFTVRSYVYSSGLSFVEYTSHLRLGTWPLVHVTIGRNPETGRRKVARGVVAVGRIAVGALPIGQIALGLLPIGQLAIGLTALGQAAVSVLLGVGQLAIGWVAIGQLAIGWTAVGQIAIGHYVLGQLPIGEIAYGPRIKDPRAIEFFRRFLPWLGGGS